MSAVFRSLEQAGLLSPRLLTLAITGDCNLVCRHCWVAAGEAASPGHVSAGTVARLMTEFAAMGGQGVRFTGGEPLCHPEWLDLVRHAGSLGFKNVALQTNALLLTEDDAAALSGLNSPNLSIQVSLDGAYPQTHDLVRGAGTFRKTMEKLVLLVRGGLGSRLSIFLTEMNHNLGEIPDLLELACGLGVGAVSSGGMVLCGRASEAPALLPPRVDQYLALLDHYDSDPRFRELYGKIGNVAALEWHAGDAVRHDCCSFVENPYLSPSGRLYPCLMCHAEAYSVTGVFEKGLTAALIEGVPLWTALLHISRSRADEIPECRDCPGRMQCAGGCMGRAWGSCRDLMSADDRCEVRRSIYRVNEIPEDASR